jgi:hypothetical protein
MGRFFWLMLRVGVLLLAGCESRLITEADTPPPPVVVPAAAVDDDQFAARLEAARGISNSFTRDEALKSLAMKAAAAGQGKVARACLAELCNSFTRDETAARCARALARCGQGHAAVEIAGLIGNSYQRDEVLTRMAAGR